MHSAFVISASYQLLLLAEFNVAVLIHDGRPYSHVFLLPFDGDYVTLVSF